MPLSTGQHLGPYEILSAIGAGGMGEVYRARDARLGRDVAVKVLPAQLSDSVQARQRFQREAEAVAALQHPNICTVYDVGETADGHAFLVMELLQGDPLHARLARGPLEIPIVIDTAIALAGALEAAHGAGIIHRDVKPANIFLTAHGPKILDFGLAKAAPLAEPAVSRDATKAASPMLTNPGSTVGTVAYMSPEQLRGDAIDARSDLFSFGLVLYEMGTGRPAFGGATGAVIAAAILHQAPSPPRTLRADLPAPLEQVILKAIEKDRGLRYQHAADIRADLQRLKRDSDSASSAVQVPSGPSGPSRVQTRRRLPIVAAAAVLLLAVAVGGYLFFRRPPTLTDKDTIVLADFKNTTGDEVFDETLRRGLAVQLEQSPFLSLISDQRIRRTLGLMGRPLDTRLTPDIAREICERTGSAAVLAGSIAALGTQYVLGLHASNCRTGDVLAEQQAQAARKEDVLNALSQIAKTFRTRVGESLATVEKHSMPLEEATTASLEALKAFSAGWRVTGTEGTIPGLPLYKRATEIDPQFAIAFANLGLAYSSLSEAARSAESTTRAYELRHRASDRERFYITTMYDRQVTGNLERELQTLTLWAQTYPRDPIAHGLLAGFVTAGTGRYELCLAEAPKAMALDPDLIYPYLSLITCNLFLERLDQAERAWQRAATLNSTGREVPALGYHLAFLRGDRAEMDRQAAVLQTRPGGDETIAHMEALVLARAGRLQSAAAMSGRAADLAERAGRREGAATYVAAAAVWNAFFSDLPAARQRAAVALQLSKGRDAEYAAGVALALAGDVTQAQSIAADLEKRYPEDTSVQTSYLPTLRALFSVQAGQPSRAIEQLQAARTYEFANPAINFLGYFGGLYPVYVRGGAYLAAKKGAEAAAEFQKILDHRGLVLADPMAARARVELGRAWTMAGDRAKARAAYEDFLALWKDADPGVPLLAQAKAEYAKLP